VEVTAARLGLAQIKQERVNEEELNFLAQQGIPIQEGCIPLMLILKPNLQI
jgi:hypothetical protein